MKIPTLITVCAFAFYLLLLRVKYELWRNPNLYMALLKHVVQIENRTSCWACGMKPEGLSLVATPIKSVVLVHQNLTGQNVTTGRENTRRIRVLKMMPSSRPTLCIDINRTREQLQTFLGAYSPSYCNDAQFVFSMLWKNATEERRADDGWSLEISRMMLAGGQQGYMNYPSEVGINKTLCNYSLPGTPKITTCWNLLQLELAMIGAGTALNVSRLMFPQGSVTLQPPYYFVCGRWAYAWLPTSSYGRCTVATLAPAIVILEKNRTTETNLLLQHLWSKMEGLTTQDYPRAWSPSWTRWHLDTMIRLNNYSGILDAMFEEAVEETTVNSVEVAQERKLAFHRKLAEDYKLFAQGGLCRIVNGDCCTWIGDSGDTWVGDSEDTIYNHLRKVKKLQNKARETGHERWKPFKKVTISDIFGAMGAYSGAMTAFAIMIPMLILLQYRIRLTVRGKARDTGNESWSTGSFFRQITECLLISSLLRWIADLTEN